MLAELLLLSTGLFLQVPQEDITSQPASNGFYGKSRVTQKELEKDFLTLPKPENCRNFLRILTEDPHMAGTPGDKKTADYVRSRLLDYGWDAELVEYHVYLPYPREVSLEMLAPENYSAKLQEKGWSWDKDSDSPDAVKPFLAYAASGDLTADLVYVNYGLPEDYQTIEELGVDVRGKIVIARYGKSFRGVKAHLAQQYGAAGLILYSDPSDDGYAKGDVYPRGPWRPASSIQRGSIQWSFLYPGDPLSPGWAAVPGARRIEAEHAKSLPHIPCLPISYEDATPLLENLAGPNVPEKWQGHLPFAYHVGPGPTRVHLKLDMDFQDRPIWNVIATMPGAQLPDEWVLLGNHRDAWVHGAVDPSSGTSVMLETARCLGEMRKNGWQPKRTLVFCSWDAEEFGLIGSTEWVEDKADELNNKVVAYINVDAAVCGSKFHAGGVPEFNAFVQTLAQDVVDLRTQQPVYNSWENDNFVPGSEPTLSPLGGGSDYVAFIHYLGIPSIDLGMGGPYGVYHSMLDNFYWMSQFGDPTFENHATMSKIAGLAVLRLAQCDLYPINPALIGESIFTELQNIESSTAELPQDFAIAKETAAKLIRRANRFLLRCNEALESNNLQELASLNHALRQLGKTFIDPQGLAGRDWYRNIRLAPGKTTGYAAISLPGVREALDAKQPQRLVAELKRLMERMNMATKLMESSNPPFLPTKELSPASGTHRR